MNIKLLLLFGMICLIGHQSFAQQNSVELLRLQNVEKYKKMKSTGAVLTVAGTILFVVGTVTLYNTFDMWDGSTTGNPEAGAVCTLLGMGGLGSGIPLWIVGAHKHKKYNSQPGQVTVRLNANPRQQGLTFTYRF